MTIVARLSGSFAIDIGFGDFGQEFVRLLLLLEGLFENGLGIAEAQLPRPGNESAIARDLIMLDRLGGSEKAGIAHFRILDVFKQVFRFLQEPIESRAVLAARRKLNQFENLLEPRNMRFGLGGMILEGSAQFRVV